MDRNRLAREQGTKVGTMKEYELIVSLVRGHSLTDPEEWQEQTWVNANSMAEAKKMAGEFAREQAKENGARVEDYYAIDTETLEYSE